MSDFCADPDQDPLCVGCRGGRPWQLLIDNAWPRECCRENGRTPTKEDRKAYGLVGLHQWKQCAQCKRTWTREWEQDNDFRSG